MIPPKLLKQEQKYVAAMRENADLMKKFVVEQLGKEIGELHEDPESYGKFSKLEDFVVILLSKKLQNFTKIKGLG